MPARKAVPANENSTMLQIVCIWVLILLAMAKKQHRLYATFQRAKSGEPLALLS